MDESGEPWAEEMGIVEARKIETEVRERCAGGPLIEDGCGEGEGVINMELDGLEITVWVEEGWGELIECLRRVHKEEQALGWGLIVE